MTEDHAAQVLNATIVVLLGVLVLGFFGWTTLTGFGEVRVIYRSLPSNEQREVDDFLRSVGMLTITATAAITILSRSKHPAIQGSLQGWPIWALAGAGAISLGLGFRSPGYIWLASAGVFLAAILIKRWRTPRGERSSL